MTEQASTWKFDRAKTANTVKVPIRSDNLKTGQIQVIVQTYSDPNLKCPYGPVVMVIDHFIPENPKASKPLAQGNLTPMQAQQVAVALLKGVLKCNELLDRNVLCRAVRDEL